MNVFSAMLPVPPSSNNAYVNVPKGGRKLSKDARAWQKLAAGLLVKRRQELKREGKTFPMKHVMCFVSMNIDYRSDITNRIKLLHDALEEAGIIENDRFIELEATERAPHYADIQLRETKPLPVNMVHVQVRSCDVPNGAVQPTATIN